jgi:predicted transcriptional regulator
MTTTIRVSLATHQKLTALAKATGSTLQTVVDQALESFRRQQVLAATNAAYAELAGDPAAWQQVEAEREVWEQTVADGLEKETW